LYVICSRALAIHPTAYAAGGLYKFKKVLELLRSIAFISAKRLDAVQKIPYNLI
jgi:hypothetical protein